MLTVDETLEYVNNECLEYEGEVWKEHPVYKGYFGSNYGRIKNGMTEKHKTRNGLEFVESCVPHIKKQLKKNKVENETFVITIDRGFHDRHRLYVHRFICECFNGIQKMVCVHRNNVMYDNRIDNLSWQKSGNRTGKTYFRDYVPATDEPEHEWIEYLKNVHVSRTGKIKVGEKDGKLLITYGRLNQCGYYYFRSHAVHRMIAETFIPNPENKKEVNHIDGNPANNDVSNLEWCTRRENMMSAETHDGISRKVLQISCDDDSVIAEWPSIRDVVKKYRCGFYGIKNCCEGKQEKCAGYKWKFKE